MRVTRGAVIFTALCVLKRTVALEGLRCAFVRIVPT